MSYLPHAKSFRDLVAYQKAKALANAKKSAASLVG